MENARNYSLGFMREGGAFQLLATLNDCDEALNEGAAFVIVEELRNLLQKHLNDAHTHERVEFINRQDAPDYVELEDAQFTLGTDGETIELEGFTLTLHHCPDDDADLSHLGAFNDTPAESYAIKCKSMGNIPHYKYFNAANVENDEQALENYKRAMDYGDTWSLIGIKVTVHKAGVRLGDASLWGIEDDSTPDYFASVANDLIADALAEAKTTLANLQN